MIGVLSVRPIRQNNSIFVLVSYWYVSLQVFVKLFQIISFILTRGYNKSLKVGRFLLSFFLFAIHRRIWDERDKRKIRNML